MKPLQKISIVAFLVILLCFSVSRWTASAVAETGGPNGMVQFTSRFTLAETSDRLTALLEERQLNLMAQIDHAQNARSIGKELRDTQLFIFGNPAVGTPLMQCAQTVAIDLPQKMLIWTDETDQVHLAYNDPYYLMDRHALGDCEMVIERVSQVLEDIATQATHEAD
ncbi:DUF302 domain-containing protein [Oscillatoria sp. CS-180]|uniref:DUF302 domain-containing protein n=1 Tax=Oscillatoria sp. CS-180 TaxID=3021720 RepID=UPI00232CC754|nr:DUF302 domain-containing protein [Oscillatoria sp. CS-180]MDB9525308.1 DUF302 domain-containing protein [Oscillatoria sp. CS-180]